MKAKYIFILIICFLLTGCIFNPYHNSKFAEIAIDAWFNDKNLGDIRKKVENINEIINKKCTYLEDNKTSYIYKCEITYQPIGETVIPLSKNKTISLYVVYTPLDKTFSCKVYNSNSKDGIWKFDDDLNY